MKGSRRLLTLALSLNLALAIQPSAALASTEGPCHEERWQRITRQEWTPQLVKGLIRCAVRRWDVPGGAAFAIEVFTCESHLWPWANGNDNLGVAQHRDLYWNERVKAKLKERWFSPPQWERINQEATIHPRAAFVARANVLIAIKMAHSGGWGPWSCA